MKVNNIDRGGEFDFGKVSEQYAAFRDIYPKSMYDRLISFGIGKKDQMILDLGSGTAVLPVNLSHTGARFFATDISENQVRHGKLLAEKKGLENIRFKVCSAEATGFENDSFDVVTAVQCFWYFDADKAAEEIFRVLKPGKKLCCISMDWLPFEDEIIAGAEKLVLKYNPGWSGGGFDRFRYRYPEWAEGRFDIETVHSYDTVIEFSKDAWIGRLMTCRGVGASLPHDKAREFEREYRVLLDKYAEPLRLKHQIHIEIYRSVKKP